MLALEQLHVTLQGLEKEGTVLFLSEKVNLDALFSVLATREWNSINN